MGQVTISGLSDSTLATMKELAILNQRSLEAQLRAVIEEEAEYRRRRALAIKDIESLREGLKGRVILSDATELIREDRER